MLVIDADDYGYAPAYDAGILEAARAGAIDGASAMVLRGSDPGPLLATGVAVGLHLESAAPPAHQLAEFERLFGRRPDYIDGHHHAHAAARFAATVADLALALGVPVRSVDPAHRDFLRELGVPTPDRLVGRMAEDAPALPVELGEWLDGAEAEPGVTEWIVHPGRPDASAGSAYDAGRAEDLALLLDLGDRDRWAERGIRRATLSQALAR
jgi:predicted glycoside hydrolase/deacetylase ChbG (UPF0249 family)